MNGKGYYGPDEILVIEGGRPLSGTVHLPGTKHGTVLAFAAAVTANAVLRLHEAPELTDRWVLGEIVTAMGGGTRDDGDVLEVDGRITGDEIPRDLARRVHGSLYLLPAVLMSRGSVLFHGAGGDGLGRFEHGLARPVRHMLEVMAEFGAEVRRSADGTIRVTRENLRPATIDALRWSTDPARPEGPYVSGVSKTALLMAAGTPGTSIVLHPHAREAQHELITVLRALGVRIEQHDDCWLIEGGAFRASAEHHLMPCPVEFATWQAVAAATGSELTATCGNSAPLYAAVHRELDFLTGIGITPTIGPTSVRLGPAAGPFPGQRLVAASTGINTDIAPLLALVLNGADGGSVVSDRVWTDRFDYVEYLNRMGADMTVRGHELHITPAPLRASAELLTPTDTRSAAVCVTAALSVPGRTAVTGLDHLERGCGRMVERLRDLGAEVHVTAGAHARAS